MRSTRASGEISTGCPVTNVGRTIAVLGRLFEDLLDDLAGPPAVLDEDVEVGGDGAHLGDRHGRMEFDAGALRGVVDHALAGPRFAEIDRLAADRHDGGSERVASGGGDQLLGDVHHVVPVGERLVQLHHGELGVVAGRHALVPEGPRDFVDPFHSAHDQPLQVELDRDAEVELHVERVVVRRERARLRAADFGMQHGCLHLDEPVLGESPTKACHGLVADLEVPTSILVDDEVGVALPEPGVDIAQPVPLVRHRPDRLREQRHLRGLDRQFALPRGHHRAVHADPVTEVERLDRGEFVVADDGFGDEQLHLARTVADRREHEFARVALEHDPTGDRHLVVGLDAGFEPAPDVADLRERVRAVEPVRVGILTLRAHLVQAGETPRLLRGEPASGQLAGLDVGVFAHG